MFRQLLPMLILTTDVFAEIRPRTPAYSDVRVGTYAGRRVAYESIGGYAVSEGDILIGTVANTKLPAAGLVSRTGSLWTGGAIPYVIDPGVTKPSQITAAMADWSSKTPITFVPRTNQANYLKFVRPQLPYACNSYVGMIGGEQVVNVGDSCGDVGVRHELGHAIGMWHEQSRNDRDNYLRISYKDVQVSCAFNFDRFQQTGREVGPYDFGSLMQYYPYAFSRTGLPTMETSPAGIPIGDVTGISALDADAVSRMYGRTARSTTISTFPENLEVLVDGVPYTRTTQFDWADGSTHTISAPETQGDARVRYAFGRWSDGGARQHTVTAAADARVFTVFLVRQYRTTITARTGGRVAVTPSSPDGFYNDRTFVTMTPTPDAGFNFLSWDNLDVDDTGRLTFIYTNNY